MRCQRGRVSWAVPSVDRTLTSGERSFDLDYPVECDDEYWTNADPSKAFMQPAGKPALVTCFNRLTKLGFITSNALRGLVSSRSSECDSSTYRIFQVLG